MNLYDDDGDWGGGGGGGESDSGSSSSLSPSSSEDEGEAYSDDVRPSKKRRVAPTLLSIPTATTPSRSKMRAPPSPPLGLEGGRARGRVRGGRGKGRGGGGARKRGRRSTGDESDDSFVVEEDDPHDVDFMSDSSVGEEDSFLDSDDDGYSNVNDWEALDRSGAGQKKNGGGARKKAAVAANGPRKVVRGKDEWRSESEEGDEGYGGDEFSEDSYEQMQKKRKREVKKFWEEDEVVDQPVRIDKIVYMKLEPTGKTFLIKFQNQSYRKVQWCTQQQVEAMHMGKMRITRFLKQLTKTRERNDGNYFEQSYLNPERIVRRRQDRRIPLDGSTASSAPVYQYLLKWSSLPYHESTWETASFIQEECPELLAEYTKRNQRPQSTEEVLRQFAPSLRKPEEFPEGEVKLPLPTFQGDFKLRDYQEEGLKWIVFCWLNHRSSILADEMGLGKTIQTTAMLKWLSQYRGVKGPFIVIVPMSTIDQWRREIETWTDLNAIIYHGNQESRKMVRRYEFYYEGDLDVNHQPISNHIPFKFNVLITTYELAIKDCDILGKIYWKYMAIDEAHRLKSSTSKLLTTLVQRFKRDHCLLLTGTPIQNDMKELFSMLNFIEPQTFGSYELFSKQYGDVTTHSQVDSLQKLLSPYILRRMKEDVTQDLPSKQETIVQVDLTRPQKTYYKALFEKNRAVLFMGVSSRNVPSLLNVLMQMRKVCNHPYLLDGVEESLVKGLTPLEIQERLVSSCAKLVLLDKLLKRLRAEGHKVLIFSQMVRMLDILDDYLRFRGYPYERLDGSTKRVDRQQAIDRFQAPGNASFAFLLSTRAGGLGLNLTAADTVIIYDSDWNPQNDLQAQARCHRIGQTKEVKIYRLITKGTYETQMLAIASKKLGLNNAVLGTSTFGADNSTGLSPDMVNSLLKYGAYSIFGGGGGVTEEDEQAQENEMLNEDLDSILSRAHTVNYEEGEDGKGKDGAMNFSTAHFVVEKNVGGNVSMDDADFWEKVLPQFKSVESLQKQLADPSELATKSQRAKYLEDLQSLVQQTKDSSRGRSWYSTVEPTQEVLNLLFKIERSKIFTGEEKSIVYTQRQQLSFKRNANPTPTTTSHRDGDYSDSYRPDNEPQPKSTARTSRNSRSRRAGLTATPSSSSSLRNTGVNWNKSQREKVRKNAIRYGFGRWSEVRAACGLESIATLEQMASFVESVLFEGYRRSHYLHSSLTPQVDKYFAEKLKPSEVRLHLSSILLEPLPEIIINCHLACQQEIMKNVTSSPPSTSTSSTVGVPVGCSLRCLRPLNASNAVSAGSELPLEVKLPAGPRTPNGEFFILVDFHTVPHTHTFVRALRLPTPHSSSASVLASEVQLVVPGFPGAHSLSIYYLSLDNGSLIQATDPLPLNIILPSLVETEEFRSPFSNYFFTWGKRLYIMEELRKLVARHGPYFNLPFPAEVKNAKLPVWWWEEAKHDRMLLSGLWKWGFGQHTNTIQTDVEYGFDTPQFKSYLVSLKKYLISEDLEKGETPKSYELDKFPNLVEMTRRANKVVMALNSTSS